MPYKDKNGKIANVDWTPESKQGAAYISQGYTYVPPTPAPTPTPAPVNNPPPAPASSPAPTPARDTSQVDVYDNSGKSTVIQAWELPSYTSRGYTNSNPTPVAPTPPITPTTPTTLVNYGNLEDRGGTIYNKTTGQAYGQGMTPEQAQAKLASDLGVTPDKIDWGQIGKQGQTDNGDTGATGGASVGAAGATGEKPFDWETKFQEFSDTFKKNQEETKKAQQDLLDKTTGDTMKKFDDMQKSSMDAFNSYFDEQSKYLDELKNQPSYVDQLNQFREQQGLPQMEATLKGIDQTILDTEGLLTNIEADVRQRTEGLPVSEAAARRLTAMEQKPLTKQMDEMLRSRTRAAAGLEAKQATVNQYLTAAQADLTAKREDARDRLGFAKDKMEFVSDMTSQSFDMFSNLQDKLFDVKMADIKSDSEFKSTLAEKGFDFWTQQQAAIAAKAEKGDEFERQLLLKKFENDLKMSNPEVQSVRDFTDASGNVTIATTYKDGTSEVMNLGQVGQREKMGLDTNVQVDNERALMSQFRGEPIVKDYNMILTQKGSIDNYINNGVGGPADLAMIFTFMKALDPSSVVRETEYDTASKSGNIFSGWAAKYNGYLKPEGGILPENVKKEFQNLINQKFQVSENLYKNLATQYSDIANRQGLNPQNVVVDYSAAGPQSSDSLFDSAFGGGSGDDFNW